MLVTVTVRGRRFPSLAVSVATRFASTMRPTTTAGDLKIRHLTGKHQGVTILGLNRPEVRNAINFAVLEQVQEATQTLPFDGKTRVVILKSEHPGTFCAGADLKERSGQSEDVYRRWSGTIREVFQALASLPVPVLAALDGHALGGGLELALAADLRVAATNAKLGLPETGLAIIPGAGGTQRLPRLVGPSLAKDMIFTGRLLSSEEALRVGLVNYSIDQNQAGDAAFLKTLQIAEEIVEKGPIAVRMAKQAINQGIEVDINSGLELEKAAYSHVIPTEDRIEGLKAFREKRKPLYKGR